MGSVGQIAFGAVETPSGQAALADLAGPDVEAVVAYWHGVADLDFLGIDRARMGTREETHARIARTLRSGEPDQKSVSFGILLNGELIGYTLLNRYAPDTNYSHWHIVRPELRAAGISSALYPHRIEMYFALYPLTRLIHQTRTRNVGVNRMLDKFVPVAETRFVERPDGFAGPGEFHMRHVYRDDIPAFFRRAGELVRRNTS